MPTTRGPSGQAQRADKTSQPALKRCLGAAVLTADRIDYWIRRHMIACSLEVAGDVAAALGSVESQMPEPRPASARASARSPVRPPRVERRVRRKPALACDRRAWLSPLGRALKDEYDALAVPVPPRLAALVSRLEALD